jgi:hypothetical protein
MEFRISALLVLQFSEIIFNFSALTPYISLFSNLLVTPPLIVWIWKAKRKVKSLLGNTTPAKTQIPYNRLIRVLTESALPPLVLGISHLAVFLSDRKTRERRSVVLSIIWWIFTASYWLLGNLFLDW